MKRYYLVNPIINCALLALSLSACVNLDTPKCVDCNMPQNQYSNTYVCNNASAYNGKVIGDGHCVTLIKHCTGAANTDQWQPGQTVWQNNIQTGTIIATFNNGRYPNTSGYHAAVYIKQDSSGIWVWDQWQGKAVHKRLIRWRDDGAQHSNTAQSYQTVLKVN